MKPLAERLRPKKLDDFINQEHLIGKNGIINQMIRENFLFSMIFYGPSGTGKTSLAELIALETKREFYALSAINSGVKEVRETLELAKDKTLFSNKPPILFIDEIHRFSKSQQDSLLQAVEKGYVVLIGATTENPSFEVIPALLSRCQVYILNPFSKENLDILLKKALDEDEYLKNKNIKVEQTNALIHFSSYDARKLLNSLELIVKYQSNEEEILINNENVEKSLQQTLVNYDKNGEQHYNVISAFIKSIRGSDADAALFYLAVMLNAGEDILFIARRLVILSAEDIGLANPTALVIANSCFQATQNIGNPEARIILSECVIYLATSPKSNSAYKAINKALDYVKNNPNFTIPLHLRNAPTSFMKNLGYGKDYKYAHNFDNHYVEQKYLPDEVQDIEFYTPANNPKEQAILQFINHIKKK
jgi:putative ATPase